MFVANVLYYFMLEAFRRFRIWVREMLELLRAIMLGLVPIATLPALLWGTDEEGGQAANIVSLKMYQVLTQRCSAQRAYKHTLLVS